jgi:phosphoribosylformylglycinamidine synthase
VSFYNQNPDGPVFPTPTIGMVGLLDSLDQRMTLDFKSADTLIYVLGPLHDDLSSSQYLAQFHQVMHSPAPVFDLDTEQRLQVLISQLIRDRQILSAHDISEGGLFQTLCESSFPNELGFSIQLPQGIRTDAFLFGESQSRVVASVSMEQQVSFLQAVADFPCMQLGVVTTGDFYVDGNQWGAVMDWKDKHEKAIGQLMRTETDL